MTDGNDRCERQGVTPSTVPLRKQRASIEAMKAAASDHPDDGDEVDRLVRGTAVVLAARRSSDDARSSQLLRLVARHAGPALDALSFLVKERFDEQVSATARANAVARIAASKLGA
jgi:hypothetical protein